jgi:D-alanyl-D-alanine carboxypeptidase
MKLFVMIAAISHLGPDFSFETVLGVQAENLVVIGDGDPGRKDSNCAN